MSFDRTGIVINNVIIVFKASFKQKHVACWLQGMIDNMIYDLAVVNDAKGFFQVFQNLAEATTANGFFQVFQNLAEATTRRICTFAITFVLLILICFCLDNHATGN